MTATRTRRTAAQTRQATVEFVNMVLANGTCTRPEVTVGSTGCVGTVVYAEADAISTGVWEVVDHTTGNPAVYRSMPAQKFTVSLVSRDYHGSVVRSHTFHTDDAKAAWGYLRILADETDLTERPARAWAMVCSA